MRLTVLEAWRLWRTYRRHAWLRPREGWLRWLLWGRRVAGMADPVCEGPVEATAPVGMYAHTVPIWPRGFSS